MRIHPKLLLLTVFNLLGSLAVFYVLNLGSMKKEVGGAMLFEALGWIAFFYVIVPRFVKNEVKAAWYSQYYRRGTFLVLLLNVFVPALAAWIYLNYL